jgi:hypothetical protein
MRPRHPLFAQALSYRALCRVSGRALIFLVMGWASHLDTWAAHPYMGFRSLPVRPEKNKSLAIRLPPLKKKLFIFLVVLSADLTSAFIATNAVQALRSNASSPQMLEK